MQQGNIGMTHATDIDAIENNRPQIAEAGTADWEIERNFEWLRDMEDEAWGMTGPYYTDNNGTQHENYEAACLYYGVDTPAQLEAEARYDAELGKAAEAAARDLDPDYDAKLATFRAGVRALDDECPF